MEEEYLKRWRLILGGNEADGTGITLTPEEQRIDQSLEAVYDSDRRGGLGSSAPKVSRWLGDIREFFPQTVVQVIQRDAIKRLNITSLLTEKEMLETVVPDVHLVATLMSLSRVIPEKNKEMARQVVSLGQSSMETGWRAFEDSRNRYALLSAFTEQTTSAFRQMWYDYHRNGLDQMALSVDKGRAKITESLALLQSVFDVAPMSVLFPLYHDSKLDELVNIYSKASATEKSKVYDLLYGIYPTDTKQLSKIKETVR